MTGEWKAVAGAVGYLVGLPAVPLVLLGGSTRTCHRWSHPPAPLLDRSAAKERALAEQQEQLLQARADAERKLDGVAARLRAVAERERELEQRQELLMQQVGGGDEAIGGSWAWALSDFYAGTGWAWCCMQGRRIGCIAPPLLPPAGPASTGASRAAAGGAGSAGALAAAA